MNLLFLLRYKVTVRIIKTNEELMIAKMVREVLNYTINSAARTINKIGNKMWCELCSDY